MIRGDLTPQCAAMVRAVLDALSAPDGGESAAPLIRAGSPASGTHPRRPRSGLISANAGNGAGGIITYASARSQLGYRMLFLMVLITMALVVVQEMCSRLGAYTREGLGALIREQFPLRSGAPRCCSCSSPTRD